MKTVGVLFAVALVLGAFTFNARAGTPQHVQHPWWGIWSFADRAAR